MNTIDFNHKTFLLVSNTANGKVNTETLFRYRQEGNLVTADYSGGTIIYGKIIALLVDTKLQMLYQCLTTQNELKAGKATANISFADNGKMKLQLNWEWLNDNHQTGTSEYIEN